MQWKSPEQIGLTVVRWPESFPSYGDHLAMNPVTELTRSNEAVNVN